MSTLKMTPELETAIRGAQATEIPGLIQAQLAKQDEEERTATEKAAADKAVADKAAADKAAADKAAADAAVTHDKPVSRTEVINGKELIFEGATDAEVDQLILNAYRVANAVGVAEVQTVAVDPEKEAADQAAAEAAEAARQTELQLKMQRGEISVKAYLEQSGAVAEYLAEQGISVEDLRGTVEKTKATQYEQDWIQAGEAFLQGPGADWPGGEKNRMILQNTIVVMGLMDAEDKVGALMKAYSKMKQDGTIFPYEAPKTETRTETRTETPAAATTTAASAASSTAAATEVAIPKNADELKAYVAAAVQKEIQERLAAAEAAKKAPTSSSVFGASSGISGVTGAAGSAEAKIRSDAAAAEALKNATPAEILEAWKQEQLKGGKDPNAAFLESFSARR